MRVSDTNVCNLLELHRHITYEVYEQKPHRIRTLYLQHTATSALNMKLRIIQPRDKPEPPEANQKRPKTNTRVPASSFPKPSELNTQLRHIPRNPQPLEEREQYMVEEDVEGALIVELRTVRMDPLVPPKLPWPHPETGSSVVGRVDTKR